MSTLHEHGYEGRDGLAFIQCFEVANLKEMRRMTALPIIQLMEEEGGPYDFVARGEKLTYQ
ncbi:glycerophosphodiester phosphodiesterase, partial [Pseudomonas aeruginosa]